MLFITIYSVGYGDLYPSTYIGRLVSVVVAAFGTFLIAVIIRVMHEFFTMKHNEKTCLMFVKGNQLKNKQKQIIIIIFQRLFRLKLYRKIMRHFKGGDYSQ